MTTSIQYTPKERTQRTLTVVQAQDTALTLLKDRHKVETLCINACKQMQDSDTLTYPEFNDLVSSLYDDTLYHEGKWFGTN